MCLIGAVTFLWLCNNLIFTGWWINFTEINSDGEVIITKFSKHKREFNGLNEYYDSDYTETESESSSETESEDEVTYDNDVPPPMFMDTERFYHHI